RKGDEKEIQGRTRNPTRKRGPSPPRGALKELCGRVGPAAHNERVRDDDSEERHEETADQEQESFVSASDPLAAAPEECGARHRDQGRGRDERQLASLRGQIL